MTRQTTVTLVDDLDGGEAVEQMTFGLDGHLYEIDLSAANSATLREVLAPYVAAGRRKTSRPAAGRRST
ncbi:histone-like nucleoid-structuring protein Lsr2 [Pseudonocardia sp. TRM90224]|uniref:histone-like nucleoid-structuring protein Lsr2 n=1 Tax=Pseudonocardia sp. TRM90224 TaxID=2812678 RepID=UPI001E3A60C8|nr:Lsr2 family protein [Pseudonocardia sp. TRM90224]